LLNAPTEGESIPQVRKTAVDTGPAQWKGQAAEDFAETDSSAAVLVQLFHCNRAGTIGEEISFQPSAERGKNPQKTQIRAWRQCLAVHFGHFTRLFHHK